MTSFIERKISHFSYLPIVSCTAVIESTFTLFTILAVSTLEIGIELDGFISDEIYYLSRMKISFAII